MGGLSELLDPRAEEARSDATVKTYVYLRASLIAAVLLVFAALAFEIGGSREWLNSISHYYYTPVGSVFVGALVGMGFALVALAGRPGPEDTALNLAGMLAPVVAFVPTPVDCGSGTEKCVPDAYVPGVVNNIAALLAVGFVGLVFAAITVRRLHREDRWSRWGFVVAGILWVAALLWFGFGEDWASRASFLRFAHYGAAVPMFALIIVVVFINGFRSEATVQIGRHRLSYRLVYQAIAVLMALAVIIGFAAWMGTRSDENPPPVIFWIEAALLLFFGVFWGLQTWEFRKIGPPLGPFGSASASASGSAATPGRGAHRAR
jgi:hypothetical protein